LDKWIDEKVKEGNNLETVCSWLGVPVIYNSPTIIDFCKNQHNNPDRKITSKNHFNDYIDSFKINPTTPIEQVEWWKPGVPILKSDTNFWFYISLSNLSGKSNYWSFA